MRGVMKRALTHVRLRAFFARAGAPPAWVRAVDLLCLGLVILAGVVTLTGGLRLHLAGARFAVTSPYRLVFWAIGIGLLRHVAAPALPTCRARSAVRREYLRSRAMDAGVLRNAARARRRCNPAVVDGPEPHRGLQPRVSLGVHLVGSRHCSPRA